MLPVAWAVTLLSSTQSYSGIRSLGIASHCHTSTITSPAPVVPACLDGVMDEALQINTDSLIIICMQPGSEMTLCLTRWCASKVLPRTARLSPDFLNFAETRRLVHSLVLTDSHKQQAAASYKETHFFIQFDEVNSIVKKLSREHTSTSLTASWSSKAISKTQENPSLPKVHEVYKYTVELNCDGGGNMK